MGLGVWGWKTGCRLYYTVSQESRKIQQQVQPLGTLAIFSGLAFQLGVTMVTLTFPLS